MIDIKDAEDGQLKEPPWCFVKTRFGQVEGHVAIVEMLAALKRGFLPDLEVSDDGAKHSRRQQERLQRASEELRSRGADDETTLRDALQDFVPNNPDEEIDQSDEPWRNDEHAAFAESSEDGDGHYFRTGQGSIDVISCCVRRDGGLSGRDPHAVNRKLDVSQGSISATAI